jgi:hypothetical protein
MNNDIVSRLYHSTDYDIDLISEAINEIERLQAELKLCIAERDHHLKWSRTYELELKDLRNQIKNSN